MAPYDWTDAGSVDVFFEWWVWFYFYGEEMLFCRMDVEFKDKII